MVNSNAQNLTDFPSSKAAVQEAKLLAFDGGADDFFGQSVSLSGDRAVVGAAFHDLTVSEVLLDNAGAVYYYELEDGAWVFQQKITASDASINDQFGDEVSLDGNRLMVGSFRNDELSGDAGAVYVFEHDGFSWVETQKLTASDAANSDWFGRTIELDQNIAVIGATNDDDLGNRSGSVYVFGFNGQNWIERQKLVASDGADGSRFGASLSLSGTRMVIGANFHTVNELFGGAAYVFDYDSTLDQWIESQQLLADLTVDEAAFGHDVSLSGDRIVVGAIEDDGDEAGSGVAYVFDFEKGSWLLSQKLIEPSMETRDEYGSAVSVVGDRIYVGAQNAGFNGAFSGVMYAYDLVGNDWQRTDEVFAADANARDEFGVSISTHDGKMLIGAHRDTESGTNAGSAYVMNASFPVKVTVSGLAEGNTVQLQNNGGDALVVSDNSSVIFSEQLYAEDVYQVSVKTQPMAPNQTCAVKQLNTTIQADGANHVDVACVFTPYFVAGTVFNLFDNNELVLQNNGGDDLVINQRGGFVFALPMNDQESYEVSISSMPNDPIQPCEVINAQGSIQGSDVDDVVISCGPGDDLIMKNGFESLDQ